MADKRISQLIERTDILNNDVLPIVASGATTTNKVTISTIQNWMQDNLDVGVTSVGITLGSSGTDVNVTGSPITTSGNITINIPTASATNRGLLSASDWSTFTNDRVPYTGATGAVNLGTHAFAASQININGTSPTGGSYLGFKHATSVNTGTSGYTSMYTFGTNFIGFKSVSGGTNKDFSFDMSTITSNVAGGRIYSLPDASGTLALTSDLGGYVTLGTAQTITATKTFTTSGSGNTININHTSGSGHGVEITKSGNGEGLRVIKTSGGGNAVTITGGLLSAEAATLTGALNGTSAVFSGNLSTSGILIGRTTNGQAFGVGNGVDSDIGIFVQTNNIAFSNSGTNSGISFALGGVTRFSLAGSTGAATFTGALNGTSASFSGLVSGGTGLRATGGTDAGSQLSLFANGSGNTFIAGFDINFNTGSNNARTTCLTLASTGAATFSSSVTVGASTNGRLGVRGTTNNSSAYAFEAANSSGNSLFLVRNDGNVGIGAVPSFQLQLSTDSAAKPTSALWTIASDERIKENITPYEKGIEDLMKINPVNYDYNGLGGFTKGKGGVGIIAQEIAEVLPDSVNSFKGKLHEEDEEETEILNFNGHELIYVLINSVKELKAEIESLKSQING